MSFWRKMQIKFYNRWNNKEFKSKVLLILFLLSIFSFFSAFRLNMYFINNSAYSGINNSRWIYFIFIPIPLISTILGIKYNKLGYSCNKNIVAGIIIIWLLVQCGISETSYTYKIDNTLINKYEKIVNIDFPNNVQVANSTEDKPLNTELYKVNNTSYVIFKNKKEIKEFDKYIKSDNRWIKKSDMSVNKLNVLAHTDHNDKYDNIYYMYYIVDNDFNIIPNIKGNYKAYSFIYNMDNKGLEINEYNLIIH